VRNVRTEIVFEFFIYLYIVLKLGFCRMEYFENLALVEFSTWRRKSVSFETLALIAVYIFRKRFCEG